MRLMNLILHFDINKTIIVSDASTNRGMQSSLHSLMSEVCWGQFDSSIAKMDRTADNWTPVLNAPSVSPPSEDAVTFGTYLEDHTLISKAERRRLKTNFALPGEIGHRYESYVQELQNKLSCSPLIHDHSGVDAGKSLGENADSPSPARSHFILPSFFNLLDYLFSDDVLSTINWRIVFRSFGTDTTDVMQEINHYLNGNHPAFKPTNLATASRYCITLPHDSGAFIRPGPSSHDVQLAFIKNNVISTIIRSSNIHHYIQHDWLKMHENHFTDSSIKRFIVLRDDYLWWEANHEADDSGKLFLIDKRTLNLTQNDNNNEDLLYQVFFDDNIERDRAHIVDVRDVNSFEPIPFSETNGMVLLRVEPYLAILDDNYFLNQVRNCISQWRC